MKIAVDPASLWVLRPTQQKVLDALETLPDMGMVAYIGVLGGGKTWLLCRLMLGMALQYPGFRGFIGRQYAVDLEETTRRTWADLLAACQAQIDTPARQAGVRPEKIPRLCTYLKQESRYTFANGSVVLFGALERGHEKWKSLEIHAYGLDEASQISDEAVMILHGRIRAAHCGAPRCGLAVSNPSSKLHWLYDWFVRDPRPGHLLFRANPDENRVNLPPNYYETLRSKYTPEMIARYLDGHWGDIGGGDPLFPTFRTALHVQSAPYQPTQPLLVGVDYGFQSPAVVWAQRRGADRLHVLHTWLPRQIDTYRLAQGILRATTERWPKAAPPQVFAGVDGGMKKDTEGKSSADILAGFGLRPMARYYATERGWNILRHLLEPGPDGVARFTVEPTAANAPLIDALDGGLRYQRDKEALVEKTGIYDPPADALRYILVHTFPAVTADRARAVPFFRPERRPGPPRVRVVIPGVPTLPRRSRAARAG